MLEAGIILAVTYTGIAVTRLPRLNLDRPAAALLGAVLMILAGVLTFQEAVASVDFNTLTLLFGMMLLVAVLQRGGFFEVLAARAVTVASSPPKLLVSVVVMTAVASALLVNDVVVLLFTPVVIQACRLQRANPVPYLIGEAMASNIGSTATIVGNPQNMLIGVTSGISFARFFVYLAPVAIVGTLILLGVLWLFYRRKLASEVPGPLVAPSLGVSRPLPGETAALLHPAASASLMDTRVLARVLPVLGLVTVAFFFSSFIGLSIPMIALVAGTAAMLVSGIRPSEVMRSVDWVLLLFFAGFFVVIGGARQAGLLDLLLQRVDLSVGAGGILSIHLFSAVVSQLVSNVPLTMLMLPLLQHLPGDTLWISLAAGATLGGNATLIGAVANLIVVEQAYREGVVVRFGEFLKVGLVVTALTLAASVGILLLEFNLGLLR
ncbi:MAG: anion transporter [Dehalococcoidia bacterium]|nr:anion transporter [Dehalococcoidia bacterium]